MNNFTLNDNLSHKAYSWPKTVISYQFNGDAPVIGEDVLLMDEKPVAYQVEQRPGGYELKVLADLPTGAKHEFSWGKSKNIPYSKLNEGMDNGVLSIENICGGLFSVSCFNGTQYFYSLKTQKKLTSESQTITGGAIEKALEKTLLFADGAVYKVVVKIKKDLDYVEIYETMKGFEQGEAFLEVSWKNFNACHRYTLDRKEEKVDIYLKEDGSFPFVINPYMPRVSVWDQRYVAYIDKERNCWTGLLLHDLEWYDDGQYAIWGSSNKLAFSLYTDKYVAPILEGKRAFINVFCADKEVESLGNLYLRYFSLISLNKVKDWILDWEDNQDEYPKYFAVKDDRLTNYWHFKRAGTPEPSDMMDILDKYYTTFHKLEQIEPVHCREFIYAWTPIFDMTASKLSEKDFRRVRAAMAFTCYVLASENYCPIDNMLAGHPNFLTDMLGALGAFTAILGPKHPMYQNWLGRYEIALARNMKYHIRPDVEQWNSLGGRWTENVGCYMFAMLHATVFVCSLIYHTSNGEMPLLYPHFTKLLSFLVNMQTVENLDGRRLYLPQGAHSCTGEFGGTLGHGYFLTMIQLAEMCRYYEPLLSEYILHNYREEDNFNKAICEAPAFECGGYISKANNHGGTSPAVKSMKFTGMGFSLRHSTNTDKEMHVFLQQIDEGPNYRWGRPAQGGCGEMHYYANGRRYTDHAPEDVGDENRGDVQSCTNFGVLIGHEFRSVGRNDLTEPLMDFDFVQYARVNAGEYSYPYYRYRSIMMVENQYIAVYDAVGDVRQYGRFSWSQNKGEEFPNIWNIKPGADNKELSSGEPCEVTFPYYVPSENAPKILACDGKGDFLTIVSHLKEIEKPERKEYGCELKLPSRFDKIFNDSARVCYQDSNVKFNGFVGYYSQDGFGSRFAIFDGQMISGNGYSLRIPYNKFDRNGMSMQVSEGKIFGKAVFANCGEVDVCTGHTIPLSVWIDGEKVATTFDKGKYRFMMPKGMHAWNIGLYPIIKRAKITNIVSDKNSCECMYERLDLIDGYEVQISSDAEKSWVTVGTVVENLYRIDNLKIGKYHIRVRGIRGLEKGEFSHPYPVYITNDKPHCPDGLRVIKMQQGEYEVSWGEVLGCSKYRLYLQQSDAEQLIYEGDKRKVYSTQEGSYCVSAVNGNGESIKSNLQSTLDKVACWDNHPEKGFVRDTRSFEHGYPGFDYVNNPSRPILTYPEENK